MSSKYTVKITSANADNTVVQFKVMREVAVFHKGHKTGTRTVLAGEGMVIGSDGSYGHGDSMGWAFKVEKGQATAENILAALTDKTASLYIK